MRAIVFRTLAGLLAAAFGWLLVFTSSMSLRTQIGMGVIATGFALYSALGSDLGERFIFQAFGGRSQEPPEDDRAGP